MLSRLSFLTKKKQTGFTLIELVMAIVLLAVVSLGVTSVIKLSTQTTVNVSSRDELMSTARFAIERLNRELRNALPNSIRIRNKTTSTNYQCLEFVPIVASTTYTDIPISPEPSSNELKVIPFIDNDGNSYTCPSDCLDSVVVYPLEASDVYTHLYDGTGKTFGLKAIDKSNPNEWVLSTDFDGDVDSDGEEDGITFNSASPTNRLYIIGKPVSYCIANNKLSRYEGYGYTPSQAAPPIAAPTMMAQYVDNMNIPISAFNYSQATLLRNALIEISLYFTKNGEDLVFHQQIHLVNVP